MSHSVILDGVNVTSYCLQGITVTRAARAAKTAKLTYQPPGTPLLPTDLIRKPITISYAGTLLFTGSVLNAVWSPKTRQYSLSCSDLYQEFFEEKTTDEILALIPGSFYSVSLFGDREDGYRAAQDIMSTVPKDVFLDAGNTLQVVDWAAKGTADRTYTGANVLNDGAYQLELMPGRDIVTQCKVKYRLRMSRWKMRKHRFSWSLYQSMDGRGATSFCEWLQDHSYVAPTIDMVSAAAEGTGWDIYKSAGDSYSLQGENPGIFIRGLPESGAVCNDTIAWINTDEAGQLFVTYAEWTGLRNWAQTVTETYDITLNCTAAQAIFGTVVLEDSVAFSAPAEDSSFEGNYSAEAMSWPQDAIEDYNEDQYDEDRRLEDLNAVIGVNYVKIWNSMRQNFVTVTIPIEPTLDLSETVRIQTADITAQGKVERITHNMPMGAHTTQVVIAITRGGGGVSDALTAPARPDTSPGYSRPPQTTAYGVYVGGCSDAPDYDEATMLGYTASEAGTVTSLHENPENDPEDPNYDPNNPDKPPVEITHTRPACSVPGVVPTPEQMYPTQLRFKGPDIEDAARDEKEGTATVGYDVAIPDDILVLT